MFIQSDDFIPVPEMYYDEETEVRFEAVLPKDIYNLMNVEMDETGNDRNEVMMEILYEGLLQRKKDRGEEVEEELETCGM